MDTVDFLSSLLEGDDKDGAISPSRSPLGSDSGISDDSSTGIGNNKPLRCLSPNGSDTDNVPSPSYSPSSSVHSDPALVPEEVCTESLEALTVQADHSYSLLQSGDGDMDILQSVRAEKPDTDVFIDLGMCSTRVLHLWVLTCTLTERFLTFCISLLSDDFVSDAMEEDDDDITTELPCTLAIEDTSQNINESSLTDQVRLLYVLSFWNLISSCWLLCVLSHRMCHWWTTNVTHKVGNHQRPHKRMLSWYLHHTAILWLFCDIYRVMIYIFITLFSFQILEE